MKKKAAENIVDEVLSDLRNRKGLDHEFDAIDPSVMEELKVDLIDIVLAQGLTMGLKSEQEHANEQVRRLMADGTCPTCGAEEGSHNRL